MANARQIRAAHEKEFAKLSKASESVEARLKSATDDVTIGALALKRVLEKEIAPNVSAKLKVDEGPDLGRQMPQSHPSAAARPGRPVPPGSNAWTPSGDGVP